MCMTIAPGTSRDGRAQRAEHAALHMRSLGISFFRHREGPGAWHACKFVICRASCTKKVSTVLMPHRA